MMDPNKRGNPPFEPSSYAAGLERRVKRLAKWTNEARVAAKMLIDGNETNKAHARRWWEIQFDQPQIVESAPEGDAQDA